MSALWTYLSGLGYGVPLYNRFLSETLPRLRDDESGGGFAQPATLASHQERPE